MHKLNRRRFLKGTATAAAGGFVLPRFAIGQAGAPAHTKVNVALIGGGNIAKVAYAGARDENIVAICDVDENMAAAGRKNHPGYHPSPGRTSTTRRA